MVLVNTTQSTDPNKSRASAPAAVNQSKSRRDLVSLSTGDELNSNYQHHNYQNMAMKTSPQHLVSSQNYAQFGKGHPHSDDVSGKISAYMNTPKGWKRFFCSCCGDLSFIVKFSFSLFRQSSRFVRYNIRGQAYEGR